MPLVIFLVALALALNGFIVYLFNDDLPMLIFVLLIFNGSIALIWTGTFDRLLGIPPPQPWWQ
jgi:hypothetical protein